MTGQRGRAEVFARAIEAAIDELQIDHFATGMQLRHKARLSIYPPQAVAEALLRQYAALSDDFLPPDPDDVTGLAAFLVLCVGGDTARKALVAVDDGRSDFLRLGEALGMVADFGSEPPEMAMEAKIAALSLGRLTRRVGGALAVNEALLELPTPLRRPILRSLLADGKPSKRLWALAALAVLFPFDGESKRIALEWLGGQDAPEVRAFLSRLPEEAVDGESFALARRTLMRLGTDGPAKGKPKGLPEVPLDWPVVEAYASTMDGTGSQGVYLLRRESSRRLALVGAVCSDVRGIADGMLIPGESPAAMRELLAQLETQAMTVTRVPAAYVLQRIRAGIAQAGALEMPLPHSFQACRYLLAGVPAGEPIDVTALVRSWADPAALPDTHYLLHTQACSSWYFDPEADGIPEALLMAFDRALSRLQPKQGELKVPAAIADVADAPNPGLLIVQQERLAAKDVDAQAKRLLTPSQRRRWSRRLAEMAYWFDCDGQMVLRTLAATAAVALSPDSGIALDDQPLPVAMLRLAALS